MAPAKATSATAPAAKSASKMYAVIRIRGTVNVNGGTQDTMKMLRLHRPNVCALIPDDPSHRGMIQRVKDHIAYGEVDAGTVAELLKQRGRTIGDGPIDDAFVSKATDGKFGTVDAFAAAVAKGEARMKDLGEDAKPYFRLHPPRGGQDGGIKKHHKVGGALGYYGKDINALLRRMM